MTELRGAATAAATIERSDMLKVPLFASVIGRMDPDTRYVVLDLGAAETATLALFGRFRCRMEIADLADGALDALNAENETERLDALVESWLPRVHSEAADIVLCWDLLNYLQRPAIAALMRRIAARSRAGTLVHALIVYSARTMPIVPARFVPIDEHRFANRAAAAPERDAPRYSPEDLKLCLPDYKTERAMLLSNGMQEFLFRL